MSASGPRVESDPTEWIDRPLPLDEFEQRIRAPLSDEELRDAAELARWFTTRYPTVAERFDYVRRAWRRWNRPCRIETPTPG